MNNECYQLQMAKTVATGTELNNVSKPTRPKKLRAEKMLFTKLSVYVVHPLEP